MKHEDTIREYYVGTQLNATKIVKAFFMGLQDPAAISKGKEYAKEEVGDLIGKHSDTLYLANQGFFSFLKRCHDIFCIQGKQEGFSIFYTVQDLDTLKHSYAIEEKRCSKYMMNIPPKKGALEQVLMLNELGPVVINTNLPGREYETINPHQIGDQGGKNET